MERALRSSGLAAGFWQLSDNTTESGRIYRTLRKTGFIKLLTKDQELTTWDEYDDYNFYDFLFETLLVL